MAGPLPRAPQPSPGQAWPAPHSRDPPAPPRPLLTPPRPAAAGGGSLASLGGRTTCPRVRRAPPRQSAILRPRSWRRAAGQCPRGLPGRGGAGPALAASSPRRLVSPEAVGSLCACGGCLWDFAEIRVQKRREKAQHRGTAGPAPDGRKAAPTALTSGARRPPQRPHRGQAPPRTPNPGVLPRALPAQADGLSRTCACARPLSSGGDHGGEGVSGPPASG